MGNRKPQVRSSAMSRCLSLSLAAMAGCVVPLTYTYAQSPPPAASAVEFDIPAGELAAALDRFAEQSGLQVVSDQSLQGIKSKVLRGRYAPEEALRRLLQGSGFGYERLNAQTLVLKKQPVAARPEPQARARGIPTTMPSAEPATQDLDKVTVTGTRIRGGTTPSPIITVGAERIQEEGFTDIGEVIRSVPQNFSGGQNPGVVPFGIAGGGVQNQNVTGGSELNLRGLGQDASLTLLNGRRMAYGGISQGVDISAIPVEAVGRIEIVADGASAIYGSDAVGGVGNVILKREFEGFTLGTRYGTATDGGLTTREYTATAGAAWSNGGLIATYKDVSADPIYARQRDYTDGLREPYTIYPGSDLRSGLLSLHQSLSDVAELSVDAFRTERSQLYFNYNNLANRITTARPETAASFVSPNIEFVLPNDWTLSVGGAWSKNNHDQFQSSENAATGDIVSVIQQCWCNKGHVYELGGEGPLFALPGGDARLAVGAGYRENEFLQYNYVAGAATIRADDSSRFAYVEINLPLLGSASNIDGAQRLELTAAMRGEDYSSFGNVNTPKFGLLYAPNADLTLKTSWGKSFKAPTLFQLYRAELVGYYFASALGGVEYPEDATALVLDGGNPDLEPERARTWTASLAFHPEAIPGLEAELTWFAIDYTNRVLQPITNSAQSLSNPAFAEFIQRSPTAEEQAAIIGRDDDGVITNQVGAPIDPDRVVAVIYYHFRNAAEQRIKGLDLSGSYRFDLGGGQLMVRGSASWLDSSQRISVNHFDLSGTLHNPPRVIGRIGAVWNQGGFTASTFANYKGGVLNVVEDEKTGSFTTLDATLRYATDRRDSAWSGWGFALSVQNLLDRAPPLHDTNRVTRYEVPPYDATNYSGVGRFLSFSISKHW